MVYDSNSASEEDDSEFEEGEDETSSKHCSECESSCSDSSNSNEVQQDEDESKQGTEPIMSNGGMSSMTSASQNTVLINLVHNLQKEVDILKSGS